MRVDIHAFAWAFFLYFFAIGNVSANATSTQVDLLARTQIPAPQITLSSESEKWLKDNKTIKIAIWGKPHPPIYMGYDNAAYEGIGADYAQIIGDALHKKIEIFHFSSSKEAKLKLEKGEIDALAFYTPSELHAENYLVTQPYLLDHQVIVHKNNFKTQLLSTLKNSDLAFVNDDDLQQSLKINYPEARLKPYVYFSEAMASLAYEATDAFWLNASTARFLMKQGVETQSKVVLHALPASANVSFAVKDENRALFNAIENTLDALSPTDRIRIVNNWGLDSSFVIKQNPLMLTAEELAWIRQHPLVPVSLPRTLHPLSFVDEGGYTNGYARSLLDLIAERTGIKFEPELTPSNAQYSLPPGGQQQGIVAALIKKPQPEYGISYSRSFAISPWVIVVDKRGTNLTSLTQMAGKKVVLTHDSGLYSLLQHQYPRVNFELASTLTDAMSLVARGNADAAISSQISADYLINKQFHQKLVITNALNIAPANFAMAVSSDNPVLLSILNKAMTQLSPKILQQDLSPWQNYQAPPKVTVWDSYSLFLMKVAGFIIILLICFFIRNRYLGRTLTQRKRYEQQLENQLRFTRTLIDDSPVALYVRDLHGHMLQCNNTYLQFMNTSLDKVKGKTLQNAGIISADSARKLQRLYDHTLLHKIPLFTQQEITSIDGKLAQVYHWSLPYRDHRGEINGIIGGFIDITEREQLLSELKQAKRVAEKASASKTIFLAQMSHEIRTPLNALIGLLELEHRKLSPPEKRERNIAVAWQASQSLLSLVGNILDMAKIESGVHNIKNTPVSLQQSVQSQVTLFSHMAQKKNLALNCYCEIENSDVLFDQTMFNQIVANLLSNAIKFTLCGKVELFLKQVESTRQGLNHYILQIADTGPGLSEYQQQAIFEPFVQVDGGIKSTQGTGLGLSICRQLANKLNGELSVESEPGNGTRFIFAFYAEANKAVSQPVVSKSTKNPIKPLKVLVVDDNAPNRLLLCQQLEFVGHHAVAVEDGRQALISWSIAEQPFDVVISDCNMPGMSGFELIKQLREKEIESNLSPRPMFGLTAMAEHEVAVRGKAAGMTACLFKPLSLDALMAYLTDHKVSQNASPDIQTSTRWNKTQFYNGMSHLNSYAMQDMTETLLASNDEELKLLERAIAAKHAKHIRDHAHRLLGTARMIKAQRLQKLCLDMEHAAAGSQWSVIRSLFESCNDEVNYIASVLQED